MNRKNRNDMKIKTFLLFAITLLIWALLFFVKLHFWGADGEDSSLESATHNIDSFEFNIQDKWIYPMSGVVFAINTTREE